MANEFAEAAAEVTGRPAANVSNDTASRAADGSAGALNPFTEAAAEVMGQKAAVVKNNVLNALGTNADQAAQDRRVASATGIPFPAVQSDPGAARQQAAAQAFDAQKVVTDYPHLARFLADPANAAIAHDDIPTTAAVEQNVRTLQPRPGVTPPTPDDIVRHVTPPVPEQSFLDKVGGTLLAGAQGLGHSFNRAAVAVNTVLGAFPVAADAVAGGTRAQDWWFGNMVAPLDRDRAALELEPNASFSQKAMHTVGSLLGTLSQITLTGGGGEAVPAAMGDTVPAATRMAAEHGIKAMAFPALADSVNTGRDVYAATSDPAQAFRAASAQWFASTTAGVAPLSVPGNVATRLATGAVSGAVTGELSRQGMNLALPSSMQTPFDWESAFLSMLTGSLMGGIMGPHPEAPILTEVVRKTYTDAARADAAAQDGAALAGIAEAATASKLRERDPDAFKQFVASAAQDGPVPAVYVDGTQLADALHQGGVGMDRLTELMPDVAKQLPEALSTGGQVRIPVEDFATHIAGSPLQDTLMPHLRTDPEGMTQAESEAFFQRHTEALQEEAQRAADAQAVGEPAQASRQQVYDRVLEQLTQANRFRPDVNQAYAALQRDFYSTMADRLGVLPHEVYERYPLRVNTDRLADGAQLEQAAKEGPFGPIFDQFAGDPAGAIAHLKEQKAGEAIGALTHPEIGAIDLPWGVEGSNAHDGYGLAKLVRWHPEVVDRLQDILTSMHVTKRTENRAQLESDDHKGAVRLQWDGEAKKWLLTAFEKEKGSGTGTRTDTVDTAGRDDSPAHASDAIVDETLNKFYQGRRVPKGWDGEGLNERTDVPPVANGNTRGAFTPATNTITLLKGADLSTFLHESGHFFLESLVDMGAKPDAPEQIKADMQAVLKWMGVKDLADWQARDIEGKRSGHEQFARGFEAYLMEGKAPSLETASLFQRFRSWLLNVYQSLKALNVDLSPEVRGVFDRMLASDDAIRQAEQARGMTALFKEKPEHLTDEQWRDYLQLGDQATGDAINEMQGKSLHDMKWLSGARSRSLRELQREANEARSEVRVEAEKEVDREPVEQARALIKEMRAAMNPEREAYSRALEQWRVNRDEAARTSAEKWEQDNPQPSIIPHVEGEKPSKADRDRYSIERKEWAKRRDDAADERAEAWGKENPEPTKPTTARDEWASRRDEEKARLAEQVKADYLARPEATDLAGIKKGQYLAKAKREMANETERRVLEWEKSNPAPKEGRTEIPMDFIADQFGFADAKALRAALDFESREQKVQALTDQRMLEQHGELATPDALEHAADAAVHNAARAKFVARGLEILLKSKGSGRLLERGAHEAAEAAIATRKVGEVNPSQYLVAEAKANREAIKLAPTDPAGAVAAQRAALLNNALVRAAQRAVDEARQARDYARSFDKRAKRLKIDPEERDLIDNLLARFDFRQVPGSGPDKKQQQLAQWVESQKSLGYTPAESPDMLNEAVRMHYKDMTVEQLRGLMDTVRSIEKIGRERKIVTVDGKRMDIVEAVAPIITNMQARGEKFTDAQLAERPRVGVDPLWRVTLDRLGSWLRAGLSEITRPDYKANRYDQHKLLGPFQKAINERLIGAAYRFGDYMDALGQLKKARMEEYGLDKEWQHSLSEVVVTHSLMDNSQEVPTKRRLTRGDLIGIAMHVGNESNFDKLARGMGWEPSAIWQTLHDNMREKDWRAAQLLGEMAGARWDEMAAMNRRLGNDTPEKIEPRPFPTQFGEMPGWYAPVRYDPIRSRLGRRKADAAAVNPAEGLFSRDYYRADTTTNGSLNSRVAGYHDFIDLDWRPIEKAITDTMRDLAYREALIDVHKIYTHGDFRHQFQRTYGPEEYKHLGDWLGRLVNSDVGEERQSKLTAIAAGARRMLVANGVAFRISTMLKHGGSAGFKSTGYFAGGGEKYFAQRVAQMATNYRNEVAEALAKFPEIRQRLRQQDRDYAQAVQSIFEPESIHGKAERFGHAGVAWLDFLTAVPTAHAAYDWAVTTGIPERLGGTGKPMSEADAIKFASKVVREAHGSTNEASQSLLINNRSEMVKTLTILHGFMNNAFGQSTDALDKVLHAQGFGKPELLARVMMSQIAPAIMAGWVTFGGPKENESWLGWAFHHIGGEFAGMVPMVREGWSAVVEGHDSAGLPPWIRALTDIYKAGKSVAKGAQGEPVKHPIKDVGNAAGLLLPGLGQAGATAQFLYDVGDGTQQPTTVAEWLRGVMSGKATAH